MLVLDLGTISPRYLSNKKLKEMENDPTRWFHPKVRCFKCHVMQTPKDDTWGAIVCGNCGQTLREPEDPAQREAREQQVQAVRDGPPERYQVEESTTSTEKDLAEMFINQARDYIKLHNADAELTEHPDRKYTEKEDLVSIAGQFLENLDLNEVYEWIDKLAQPPGKEKPCTKSGK
jgi:ribosomal protein S27E